MTLPAQPWPTWPVYGLVDDVVPIMLQCSAANEAFALATLVKVIGSSPRAIGSELLVSSRGEVYGYVSGGCVEAALAQEASECLFDHVPRMLVYGKGSPFVDIQLTCGGSIEILVRIVKPGAAWLHLLKAARSARDSLEVTTHLHTGEMDVSPRGWPRDATFRQRYVPKTRLILVGNDPVTLATAMLASNMGMEVVLWRPNGPPDGPPLGVKTYLASGLYEGLERLEIDEFTAIYCLTHDLDLDVSILQRALPSSAFCVGVLGSRSKREARVQALISRNVSMHAISRLRSPAGLPIDARTPHEIALSILAEVTLLSRAEAYGCVEGANLDTLRVAV